MSPRERAARPAALALSFLLLLEVPSAAQEFVSLGEFRLCSYYGEEISEALYGFDSDSQARQFVERILRYSGVPPGSFTIRAANVPNAAAAVRGEERLILYNQAFIEGVMQATGTPWSASSIMAHEIGHHFAGHTLGTGGSRPETELEADKFSGHVLYRMGASLQNAKAAMEAAVSSQGSATHPPKSARLAAIHNGWLEASELDSDRPGSGRPDPDSPPSNRSGELPRVDRRPDPPPPAHDISGDWSTNFDSVIRFAPNGTGGYFVTEHTMLGQVAQGSAGADGTSVRFEATSSITGLNAQCQGQISGSAMILSCWNFLSTWQMHLQRIR